MKILIVTSHFAGEHQNPWLLDDLAQVFAEKGDQVDVIVHDTKNARPSGVNITGNDNITLISVGPIKLRSGRVGKLLNHLVSGWGLHTKGYRWARRTGYDLCIYTSIGMLSWGFPGRLRRAGIVSQLVFVMWDFFPIHHREIGRIRHRILEGPLRVLEAFSIRDADSVGVMSPANERFLRQYFPEVTAPTRLIPPWASDPLRNTAQSVVKRDRFTVIFGGQLIEGRGVDTVLRAKRFLDNAELPIDLIIVGDGSTRGNLEKLARKLNLETTTFMGVMPRDEYRAFLRTAHVGIAATVPGVTPPTFPSKIVEYCASKIPVVVCIEEASDAGTLIEESGAGLSVIAGSAEALANALITLYEEYRDGHLDARAAHARAFFEENLSVTGAVNSLRSQVSASQASGSQHREEQ